MAFRGGAGAADLSSRRLSDTRLVLFALSHSLLFLFTVIHLLLLLFALSHSLLLLFTLIHLPLLLFALSHSLSLLFVLRHDKVAADQNSSWLLVSLFFSFVTFFCSHLRLFALMHSISFVFAHPIELFYFWFDLLLFAFICSHLLVCFLVSYLYRIVSYCIVSYRIC